MLFSLFEISLARSTDNLSLEDLIANQVSGFSILERFPFSSSWNSEKISRAPLIPTPKQRFSILKILRSARLVCCRHFITSAYFAVQIAEAKSCRDTKCNESLLFVFTWDTSSSKLTVLELIRLVFC